MLGFSVMVNIVLVILLIVTVVINNRDIAKLREALRIKDVPKPEKPEPKCLMDSNADGQFGIWYDQPGHFAATFYTPWHLSRKESRDLAINILQMQGADGIEAAKNLLKNIQ